MYKALYRKWRPQTFDDVISQNHVTDTLKNQIKLGKTAHAYLFTGSRGTGKTTCARIFAKSLCCLNSTDGNPCLECEICKNAELSKLSDIIEIDAASNNSVEDVRDLRENAVYLPERCRYKIFIIDEVHMLSTNAFNALLKIMEEPPQFVKFILATTEIHKVPATILSRCQRFDFKRIIPEDISNRLDYIAQNEGFTLSKDASFLIAKLSDGGMRDAISLLDQCSSYSENITVDVVSQAVGIAGREYLFDTIKYILNKDVSKIFELIENLYMQSKDLSVFCSDVISQFRNLMVLKLAPAQKNDLACMPNELEILQEVSQKMPLDDILFDLDTLESCQNRMAKSNNKRTELEIAMAEICSNIKVQEVENNLNYSMIDNQYKDMLSNLMERVNNLENNVTRVQSANNNVRKSSMVKNPPRTQSDVEFSKLSSKDFKPFQNWNTIVAELIKDNMAMSGILDNSKAYICDKYLLVNCRSGFTANFFKRPENFNQLQSIVDRVLGKNFVIKIKTANISNNNVQNNGLNNNVGNLVNRAKSMNIPTSQVG